MSEILSQDEVDSLLDGLDSGDVETEKDVPAPEAVEGIVVYDFTSQDKVVRARMPTFDVINERLSREVRATLSSLLQTNVDVSANPFDTLKFSEFVRSLPVPTSLHVFRMEPLRGHGLIVFESQLVYNLIDTFFGGEALGKARVEGREFTRIEEVMIKKAVLAVLKNIEASWLPIEPVKASLIRSEMNPQFTAIVLPTDLVLVTRFEIELEQSAGNLVVCYPYSMIEPMRNKLSSGVQAEVEEIDTNWRKRIREVILESVVELKIQLGRTEITGERLVYMQKGDVIQLDKDASEPLICYVDGLEKLTGYVGVQRGFQAFKVKDKIITDCEG
ncbi:MAG: flagellar motor switch protein FliM [Proteobacteria bacterium]|nr:flagellar motor switch protein FliM [Pseudomonadota bacterium]MBU1388954.1 flagellar motor switch protein FliM [Pseudomonadota bacterium]MBU1543506.1 flagellar motor switch protein FliM [Pseudomonadota bacterium]MBU2482617.1 flagellar motor switch protein FliM [Pseudomonadota bacterium]